MKNKKKQRICSFIKENKVFIRDTIIKVLSIINVYLITKLIIHAVSLIILTSKLIKIKVKIKIS